VEVANSVGSPGVDLGGRDPVLGSYRLRARIGGGSEGELFEATGAAQGQGQGQGDVRRLAVKIFRALSPDTEERVRQEFERLGGLDHPGIVKPVDLGRAPDGRLYLVMDLIEGAPLSSLVEHRASRAGVGAPTPTTTTADEAFARAAWDMADALAYLHARGVIHGDLSPANVRITPEGRAVLVDLGCLGLPRPGGPAAAGGVTAGARGTLGFAAPEALIGALGAASDLFSLGATLFFAWTGAAPFGVGGPSLQRLLSPAPAPAASSLRPGLGDGWDRLLGDLLERDPGRRPRSARMVLKRIRDIAGSALAPAGTRAEPGAAVLAPFPGGDPLAGIFVGPERARARARLADALDGLLMPPSARRVDGTAGSAVPVIAVVGAEGIGRRTLIRAALRESALRRLSRPGAALEIVEGSVHDLEAFLGEPGSPTGSGPQDLVEGAFGAPDPAQAEERRLVRIAERLDARASATPLCVVLEPGAESASLARVLAAAPATGRLLVLVPCDAPLRAAWAIDCVLEPFGLADVEALLAGAAELPPPAELAGRLLQLSAGVPALVALAARQWIATSREGDPRLPSEAGAGLDGWLHESFAHLAAPVRLTVARIFCGWPAAPAAPEGPETPEDGPARGLVHIGIADLDAARAAGWLVEQEGSGSGSGGEDVRGATRTLLGGGLGNEDAWPGSRSVPRGWRLPSVAHARVLESALGDLDLRPVVLETVRRARAEPETVFAPGDPAPAVGPAALRSADGVTDRAMSTRTARLGFCLKALGDARAGARALRRAAQPAVSRQDLYSERAVAWLEEAWRLAPASLSVSDSAFLAAALAVQGRNQLALERVDGSLAQDGLSADDRIRLLERKAWLLARTGQHAEAFSELSSSWSSAASSLGPAAALLVQARLARLLLSLGRFAEASRMATDALAAHGDGDGDGDGDGRRTSPHRPSLARETLGETLILAEVYTGSFEAAREHHRNLRASLADFPAARAAYLDAFIEHLAGALDAALARYRRALALSESAGDVHTRAAIALNLGALAAEAGRYDEAIAVQDRAIRELGRLGATVELGTALFNGAMLLTELGDLLAATRMLERLRDEASVSAMVQYLAAEIAARRGDADSALLSFGDAAASPGASPQLVRAARLAHAEQLARHQRLPEAWRQLRAIEEHPFAAAPSLAGADLELSWARVSLAAAVVDVDADPVSSARLETCAELAERAGRKPLAWRLALTAARLLHRAGRVAQAIPALTRAVRCFEEVRMSVPVDHRAGFESERDAHFLTELARTVRTGQPGPAGPQDDPPPGRFERGEGRLRRLLRINKRLNSELRLPRLLELIMDTVIELTEAERGFVLLEDDQGQLVVKVARNIGQQSLDAEAFELSQSIARQAATGGQPIVTIDAGMDPRFREAVSVSDLHLRSVMAVPLHIKGRAVGTLYVDNRLRKGAFGEADVELVLDFAEQAAIAIENARLMTELRRRERQIEVLNRRLERDLVARKEELSGMKVELRENREALAIRYDYKNIVGRTPRMLELFRLLDRLTDTALPVVIQGESGTGKELVARALHFNGARKHRPFVSESCAAIPETLLETTLFGSVKGAYTGADHDARGLFEVAHGGTLFLDEVGEMSPSMQGKLLRVLQTGELRRVGSERIHKVDVRIIAATNRDLARMVEEGRFRQDLFFRLSVARIGLPPLRERREDIPAIVTHFLEQARPRPSATVAAGGAAHVPHTIEPAALARLMAYRWPGNVRELENELMRAAAMCRDTITASDLSPHVGGDETSVSSADDNPDNLTLRPRVERLERSLLREALGRHSGNQTRAAEALGLSRFGLQKKLKRYRMG
jgi:transcriptional regulator with GAF, ATPase, and Fis domain/tetratricopeptide (TPR) repeat protein